MVVKACFGGRETRRLRFDLYIVMCFSFLGSTFGFGCLIVILEAHLLFVLVVFMGLCYVLLMKFTFYHNIYIYIYNK